MKYNRIINILIVVVFCLSLLIPVASTHFAGGDYSAKENRLLAKYPGVFREDGSINPQFGSELKNWFEDHLGFRDDFISLSSNIKYHLLKKSPSERVHIGKDGWFFYTLDHNLDIANGEYPLTQALLDQILESHLAIRDKLAEKGIDYVIVFPTSKVSIYPEYMRFGDGKIRQTPVDTVVNYLEDNSNLHCVRLKEDLLAAKESQQVFFKTDTHWTQSGAYIAYKKIIKEMNRWGLLDSVPAEVTFENAEYVGEFGNMMGLVLPAEPTLNSVIISPKAVSDQSSERYAAIKSLLSELSINSPCYHFTNPNNNLPSAAVFGDSMFGSWNITELLSENFSELTYLWDGGEIVEPLIDLLSPDIVIVEITERYLNTAPDKARAFLQSRLDSFESEILDWVKTEDSLIVTVRNNSDSTWTYYNQVKLGVLENGNDTGIRVELPISDSVAPGETVAFTIDYTQYPQLKNRTIEVRMLQEGVAYFNEVQIIPADLNNLDSTLIESALPDLPSARMVADKDYGKWIGRNGIWLDTCNGNLVENDALFVKEKDSKIHLTGWAADFNAELPLSDLYVQVGDHITKCTYGIDRQSVVDYYGLEDLRFTGFDIVLPKEWFDKSQIDEILFWGINSDNTALFEPVDYPIKSE